MRRRESDLSARVTHEAAADPDRSCEWSPEQRLRIERLYTGHGYQTGALGMRGALPGAGADGVAQAGVGDGDSESVFGVQEAAQ